MFSSSRYAASYFSVTNWEKKNGDEPKIRLGEGKGIFLSEIYEKISTTKLCNVSPLIKRLFFIGTDVWDDGQYLAAS